jgi:hypothetical protein
MSNDSDFQITETDDISVINTSQSAQRTMKLGVLDDYFLNKQDKIKFAVAVAIKGHLKPQKIVAEEREGGQQKDQIDPKGELMTLVKRYKNTNVPYRYAQGLAESGFAFISEMASKGWLLEDFLADEYPTVSGGS